MRFFFYAGNSKTYVSFFYAKKSLSIIKLAKKYVLFQKRGFIMDKKLQNPNRKFISRLAGKMSGWLKTHKMHLMTKGRGLFEKMMQETKYAS